MTVASVLGVEHEQLYQKTSICHSLAQPAAFIVYEGVRHSDEYLKASGPADGFASITYFDQQ